MCVEQGLRLNGCRQTRNLGGHPPAKEKREPSAPARILKKRQQLYTLFESTRQSTPGLRFARPMCGQVHPLNHSRNSLTQRTIHRLRFRALTHGPPDGVPPVHPCSSGYALPRKRAGTLTASSSEARRSVAGVPAPFSRNHSCGETQTRHQATFPRNSSTWGTHPQNQRAPVSPMHPPLLSANPKSPANKVMPAASEYLTRQNRKLFLPPSDYLGSNIPSASAYRCGFRRSFLTAPQPAPSSSQRKRGAVKPPGVYN